MWAYFGDSLCVSCAMLYGVCFCKTDCVMHDRLCGGVVTDSRPFKANELTCGFQVQCYK